MLTATVHSSLTRDLKPGEACTELGISRDKLRELLKAGEFPNAYRTGDAQNSPWRIPREDVIRYRQRQVLKLEAS